MCEPKSGGDRDLLLPSPPWKVGEQAPSLPPPVPTPMLYVSTKGTRSVDSLAGIFVFKLFVSF